MLVSCVCWCGSASITQLNAVRKHLSAIKGGQLAAAAHPAKVVALVLSDVVGDPLDVIASGPTVPDSSTFADAMAALQALHIDSLPPRVLQRLQVVLHMLQLVAAAAALCLWLSHQASCY